MAYLEEVEITKLQLDEALDCCHSSKWMAPLGMTKNDCSGDQVHLFPHWLLLIGSPLLSLLHPLQHISLHDSSTITTYLHKNLQDVVASISLLCPAGIYDNAVPCAFWAATVSPPDNSSNAVEFSPG